MLENTTEKNKTIKCTWCVNYDNESNVCLKTRLKVKPRKKRRCEAFIPDTLKIDKELNRGKDIETTLRPDWYFMRGAEKKECIKQEVAKQVKETQQQAQYSEAHPFTGGLSNIVSTAD